MIAPGSRLPFAWPSRRMPMPGMTESSTLLWQSAQVMPTLVIFPLASTVP